MPEIGGQYTQAVHSRTHFTSKFTGSALISVSHHFHSEHLKSAFGKSAPIGCLGVCVCVLVLSLCSSSSLLPNSLFHIQAHSHSTTLFYRTSTSGFFLFLFLKASRSLAFHHSFPHPSTSFGCQILKEMSRVQN